MVPCRWEKSGWRYVEKYPVEDKFFSNPNRKNYMGNSNLAASGKRHFGAGLGMTDSEDKDRFATTTYSQFFSK